MYKATVNPKKPLCPENSVAVGALLCLLAFAGCSKPLMHNEALQLSESHREESRAIQSESRGISENLTADTVIITRYDTVSRETVVAKYYGIKQSRKDTVTLFKEIKIHKTDTLWKKEVIKEKSKPGLGDKLKFALFGALLCGILFGIGKICGKVA